jgi:hypothetical protein
MPDDPEYAGLAVYIADFVHAAASFLASLLSPARAGGAKRRMSVLVDTALSVQEPSVEGAWTPGDRSKASFSLFSDYAARE